VVLTVKFAVPLVSGVPEMAPVAEFRIRLCGNAPDMIVHEYGVLPPAAAKDWLKLEPVVPLVREPVVMAGFVSTLIERVLESVIPLWSVTFTIIEKFPFTVGIPEITPSELIDIPDGRGSEPLSKDQLYGVVPPEAARFWEYDKSVSASDKLVVVILTWDSTWNESDLVSEPGVGEALSVTLTMKLDVPLVVGVPETTPVEVLSVSPDGKLPEDNDQA
jgi:hypothetical protein